jgi:hypothetical protein
MVPSPIVLWVVGGNARRQQMLSGGGGGSVVVRGRESRSHGEGIQRVRSCLQWEEIVCEYGRFVAQS